MNSRPISNDDDRRFDRLVDGELSPEEFRGLVAALDDESGGWRRCALAFLEAQALTGELSGMRRTFDFENQPIADVKSPARSKSTFNLATFLAVAASFLLAFSLGIFAPRFFAPAPQDPPLAGNISMPGAREDRGQPRHQALRPIGNVRLVMDGQAGDGSQAGEVPVYEGEDMEQIFGQQQPALAPELVELLRQRGHSVEQQQRQIVPIQLDDGRQLVVPIDGYQITPVRNRAY